MNKNVEIPDRCVKCEYYKMNNNFEYYPYPECIKAHKEISFNSKNGWDRMVWCPLLDEEVSNNEVANSI